MPNKDLSSLINLGPGILICALISVFAYGLEVIEKQFLAEAWIETLVLAILLGSIVRSCSSLPAYFDKGINFCAKILLEIAIVLLGASISVHTVLSAGWTLLAGIIVIIFLTIFISFVIGRFYGLSKNSAILVACGNAICGNSAIVATAPVINAKSEEVAASIAFTALLGAIIIFILPSLQPFFNFSFNQYGILAGMTVYAVPQVLAATAPISFVSVQIATLVKLVRVLMLGPIIFILAIIYPRPGYRLRLHSFIPWFIMGFIIMMLIRSAELIPTTALTPINFITQLFTIISMAGLGLSVDIRSLKKAGWRVICASISSIFILSIFSILMIKLFNFEHITF
ncbi:YeiH family protein [Bartonella bilalgolemii]|uniref:YeiH family protein n=1 Tax=Bartonella bilalgolemii TaxID=2942911 RepID=A0ABT0P905_9HYPH|nr:YeiH family protein [Bartonella sp. G70]MCL6229954.1 YeiH family protein [Bartonella sp. G70]